MVDINIDISAAAIRLNQAHYIRQVAEKFRQLEAAPAQSPGSQHGVLGPVPVEGEDLLDVEAFPYMSLVGCLLWITIIRPDVAAAVSRACRHSKAPTVAHWRAAVRILRYLLATGDLAKNQSCVDVCLSE